MSVIANHPESRFPRPGVPVFHPIYLPPLTGMGSEEASQIEALGRHDASSSSSTETWGRAERLGGNINAGLVITGVPREHRVSGFQETWLISYADGWVSAELHHSWDSAADIFERHAYRRAGHGPGALVTERHGYWLAADWDSNELAWCRPGTWDPVPFAVHVTTDQLLDDPGIRVWSEAQTTDDERNPAPICEMLAPELVRSTLVGYTELARERGITLQAMRNRVSQEQISPTYPDTGALWSRTAARALVAGRPETDETYRVDVSHILSVRPSFQDTWEPNADDLTEAQAIALTDELRRGAEARGLKIAARTDFQWKVDGASALESCLENGWISGARAESNRERPYRHPPAHSWSDPAPVTELPAPNERSKLPPATRESRRGLLPRRPRQS